MEPHLNLSHPPLGSSDALLGAEGVRLCLDNSHEEKCSCFPQKSLFINKNFYAKFEGEEIHFPDNLNAGPFLNATKLDKTYKKFPGHEHFNTGLSSIWVCQILFVTFGK